MAKPPLTGGLDAARAAVALQYSAHVTSAGVRYTFGYLHTPVHGPEYGIPVGGCGFALRPDHRAILLFTSEAEGRRFLDLWRSYNPTTKCPSKPYLRGRKAVR